MQKFIICVIAASVIGCAAPLPGEQAAMHSPYAAEVETAIAEWSQDYAACEPVSLRIAIVGGPEFAALCGYDNLGCHNIEPGPWRHVLIANADHPEEIANTITHESMHWLAACSGTYPDDDPEHTDDAIWGRGGILERTNNALGLPHD